MKQMSCGVILVANDASAASALCEANAGTAVPAPIVAALAKKSRRYVDSFM